MSALAWWLVLAVVATIAIAAAGRMLQRRLRTMRDDHALRPTLWNRFYALDWGNTATNNSGFSPAGVRQFEDGQRRYLLTAARAA